jgi:hypothetical protein
MAGLLLREGPGFFYRGRFQEEGTMKKRNLIIAGFMALFLGVMAHADQAEYDATFFDDPTLAYSTTPILDVSRLDTLAIQATYSSATISQFSLDDGRKSTGTFTVVSTQSLTSVMLAVNGCSFINGREWTSVSTASGTASAIATAMDASACLANVVSASWPGGTSAVVNLTADTIGTAGNSIEIFSSNSSSITVSGSTLSNGDDSNFSVSTDKVTTSSAHGISTGFALLFSTVSASTPPTGLTDQTTYYAIVTSLVDFKLADTSTNSLAGTAIDITALTGGGTFTLDPTAFAGTYSFKWQSSNDRSNWFDLPVSSTTYSAPGNTMWDGTINYKYLRLNITAGTGGGLDLNVTGFGKRRYP